MRVTYRRALGAMSLAVLGTACSAPPATFEEQAHALACAVETSTEAAAFASTGAGLEAAPEPEPAPEPSGSPNPATMCAKNVTCGPVDCVYDCGWGSHTLPLGPGGGQTSCEGGSCAAFCADRCPATKDFPAPHGAGPMTCTLASTVPSPAPVTSCEEEIVPWANCRKTWYCKRIIVDKCTGQPCPDVGTHNGSIDCRRRKGGCSHAVHSECTNSLPNCDKVNCSCTDTGWCK